MQFEEILHRKLLLNLHEEDKELKDFLQKFVPLKAQPPDWELTIMLRNIPNRMQPSDLKAEISDYLQAINFFYLRMDFKNNCNVGYCFLNFTSMERYAAFEQEFVGKQIGRKTLQISMAQVQGLKSLIAKFRSSSIMLEKAEYRPLLLKNGQVQEFPKPENGKYRKKINVLFCRNN